MIVPVFTQLLYFSMLTCEAPSYGKIPTKGISQVRGTSVSLKNITFAKQD